MIKRKGYLVFIVLILLLYVNGCTSNEDDEYFDYEGLYSARNENVDRDIKDKATIPSEIHEHNQNCNHNQDHKEVNQTTNMTWETMSEFKGIQSEIETPSIGNEGINIKDYKSGGVVVHDDITDTMYFINYGKDDYIYQRNNGESKLLIEVKSRFLYLMNNTLYFIGENISSAVKGNPQYDIYQFDLETKVLSVVVATNTISLYMNDQGIYYNDTKIEQLDAESTKFTMNNLYLAYGSSDPVKVDSVFYIPWKEYEIRRNYPTAIELYNTIDQSSISIKESEYLDNHISVYKDKLYFTEEYKLYVLDLLTGSKKVYDISVVDNLDILENSIFTKKEISENIWPIDDYTVYDDKLLIAASGRLHQVNEETGKILVLSNTGIFVEQLHIAGDKLFAIMNISSPDGSSSSELVELYFEDDHVKMIALVP